jgi:hypothetical protein
VTCRALALAALCLAAACTAPPPQATSIDALRGHVELAQLQEGRSLLVKKCSGCHATPRPAEHVSADWPVKLGEMSERAHLDLTERSLIERYLVVMATP